METAKIDIRKLQLLNDRINNTIDALNQVRMSVHGLTHSDPVTTNLGFGWNPLTSVQQIPTVPPTPWNTSPVALTPTVQNPLTIANVLGGLSHSTPDPIDANLWNRSVYDLSYLARINQTFPFALSPIPGTLSP